MKKILLAAVVFANVAILSAQQELLLINENGTGLREGKISVIDSDNDGKHNVIFAGRADKNTKDMVYIFKVQGDDTFTPVDNTIPIPGAKRKFALESVQVKPSASSRRLVSARVSTIAAQLAS